MLQCMVLETAAWVVLAYGASTFSTPSHTGSLSCALEMVPSQAQSGELEHTSLEIQVWGCWHAASLLVHSFRQSLTGLGSRGLPSLHHRSRQALYKHSEFIGACNAAQWGKVLLTT
mmetsp:Transcript_32994/g.60448  ORF Transcript_32994/g.60448 Transcript_32994/m.60448 type:complete len:116 (-) Transcript_32994:10-357(-)